MTQEKGFTAVVVLISFLIFYLHPDLSSSVLFVSSAVLFGFSLYLENQKKSDSASVQKQIKELSNKVEALYLGKGFGR